MGGGWMDYFKFKNTFTTRRGLIRQNRVKGDSEEMKIQQ